MGSTSQKTETENKPPAWAQPLFEQSATEAQKIYDSGSGGNVYQGDTTAGLGSMTRGGIEGVQNVASGLPSTSFSRQNLGAMASGRYLKNGNPYFNKALSGQLDDTRDQVQSSFAGSGRYGSGANTGVLTKELGDIRYNAMSDQFNRDTQNMLTANNMIDQSTSNLFQNKLTGKQAVIDAGRLQDASRQADLDANLQKFQATDNKDWTRLGLLQSAASGAAGNYGTNTQIQKSGTNPLSMLGGIGSMVAK